MLKRAVTRTCLALPRNAAALIPRSTVHYRPVNGITYKELRPKIADNCFVAYNATLVGDVHLAPNVSVYYTSVVRADNTPILIGEDTNVQDGAVLHSDEGAPLTIGKGVTIGHKAILHGCQVGDNVLIGMGATVMNNAVIGDNSIVGAGALVTANSKIPPNSLVIGSPAKVVRECRPAEVEGNTKSAKVYTDKIKAAKEGNHLYFE
jgi:carbonic anhydrase/acetyltransferase-like protein (isoleucine patch superfamily)